MKIFNFKTKQTGTTQKPKFIDNKTLPNGMWELSEAEMELVVAGVIQPEDQTENPDG